MPERIAQTDPYKQINEYVGSGPFRFKRDEWVPGASAEFERWDGYVPRAGVSTCHDRTSPPASAERC